METLFMLAFFLSPAFLAAFTKRFWPTMAAAWLGFIALFVAIVWWPIGLLVWAVALLVAIRAHRRAWRDQQRERSST